MAIQAYYTRPQVASLIQGIIAKAGILNFQKVNRNILDLCSGDGTLTQNISKHHQMTYVDSDGDALENAQKQTATLKPPKLYHMTAEEWALTYAEQDGYNYTFCNPPFGERVGRTDLDEFCRDLHWPEITTFENYFLRLAASVTSDALFFILPWACLKDTEETHLVLSELCARGFTPTHVYDLPVDGFMGATVNTCLLVFERNPQDPTAENWVEYFIDFWQAKQFVPPLRNPPEAQDFKTAYSTLQGYSQRGLYSLSVYDYQLDPLELATTPGSPEVALWEPQPRQIGDLWERGEEGRHYQLTASGWVPATCEGYCEGFKVSQALDKALNAAQYMTQGATKTAQAKAQGLDLAALFAEYKRLPQVSLIKHIPPSKEPLTLKDAILADLERRKMLKLLPEDRALLSDEDYLCTVGGDVYARSAPAPLLARAMMEGHTLPQEALLRVLDAMIDAEIPEDMLELRSPWLPQSAICDYYGFTLDEETGLFERNYLGPQGYAVGESGEPSFNLSSLIPWLNYNKGGTRLREYDFPHIEQYNQAFADYVRLEFDPERFNVSYRVHLAWVAKQEVALDKHLEPLPIESAIPLHPWQIEDQDFALQGEALLCWDVGLGKTLGALSAAVQKHRGQAVFVVPKSVLDKWCAELERAFPGVSYAKIGFVKKHSKKKGTYWVQDYKQIEAQIIDACYTNPVKCLFMTHDVWARLSLQDKTKKDLLKEDAYTLFQGSGKRKEKQRESYLYAQAQRDFFTTGDLSFEDLPLAQWLVVIDEAHAFKSLHPMASGGWGSSLICVGHCHESKRSLDMQHKLTLLRERGGKSLGLTATPITNSVAEVFNMLSVFAPSTLKSRGIAHTQHIISLYCNLEELTTVKLNGEILEGQTIVGFKNLSDLKAIFDSCMSTRTAKEVDLDIPQANEQMVWIEPTRAIAAFIREQQDLLDEVTAAKHSSYQAKRNLPHVFTILSKIDAVAALPSLVGISDNPKADRLVANVKALYEANPELGQIIFSDRVESHAYLQERLSQELGIGLDEIGMLNNMATPTASKRLKVQDAFNANKIKILIGGKMMGEGMDLQECTQAVHFMNLTWEDNSLHQRKGRAVRQGNSQDEVHIFYYLLKGSTDVYRQNVCAQKAGWFASLRDAQTEYMRLSVFDDPLNPELIASLSSTPEETLKTLLAQRSDATVKRVERKLKRFTKQVLLRMQPGGQLSPDKYRREVLTHLAQMDSLDTEALPQWVAAVDDIFELIHKEMHNNPCPTTSLWRAFIQDSTHGRYYLAKHLTVFWDEVSCKVSMEHRNNPTGRD